MNKYEPTRRQLCNFASGAVWYAIVFKVSAFYYFGQKLEIKTVCFDNPKLNPNNHYS